MTLHQVPICIMITANIRRAMWSTYITHLHFSLNSFRQVSSIGVKHDSCTGLCPLDINSVDDINVKPNLY